MYRVQTSPLSCTLHSDWPSPAVCSATLPAPCCSSRTPAEVTTAAPVQPAAEMTAPPPSHSQIALYAPSLPAEPSLNFSFAPMSGKKSNEGSQNRQMAVRDRRKKHPEMCNGPQAAIDRTDENPQGIILTSPRLLLHYNSAGAHSPSRCPAEFPWCVSLLPSSPPSLSSASLSQTFALPATVTTKQHHTHRYVRIYIYIHMPLTHNTPPTFMSAACLTLSTSKDSCCLVLSTSSWVCWVADSILTVSALYHHIDVFCVTTHDEALTTNLQQTSLDWSALCLYPPK